MGGWSTRAPEPETVETLLSRRLGKRYVFEHIVHKWGGHIEYRAQSATGTPVRFLFYTAAMETGFSRAFHRSGRAASRIEDRRVATLLDFGSITNSAYYAAIKHVEGPSLDELLDRGPMKTERALKLFLEIAYALQALHEAGQALGLLTPEDIILTHDAGGDESVTIPPADWVIGPLVGRAPRRFAAPEMAKQNADHRCDQYSLGFIMIEALTGHGRVEEQSAAEDVPRRVERMVRQLVDHDPNARFESLAPVCQILEDALNMGKHTPQPTPPPIPGRLATVKFEGLTDSVNTPLPTVRYGATPLGAADTIINETPPPPPRSPTPRPVSPAPPAQRSFNQFVIVAALTLALLSMIVLAATTLYSGASGPSDTVQVSATPTKIPRPAIVEATPEPEPEPEEPEPEEATDGVADAEVEAAKIAPAPGPRPRRPPPAPVVAPPPDPEPAPEPEPVAEPAPVPDPVPQPDPEPAAAVFDVQTFGGVWRGESRDIPFAFDLRMTEDGLVTGTARLTQGARISGEPLTGKWSRDGKGIEIDVETMGDKPVRYLGVLSGDLGKGVVIEKGKTKGDWEVRY